MEHIKHVKHMKHMKHMKHLRAYQAFYSFRVESQSQIKIYSKFMTLNYETY